MWVLIKATNLHLEVEFEVAVYTLGYVRSICKGFKVLYYFSGLRRGGYFADACEELGAVAKSGRHQKSSRVVVTCGVSFVGSQW